jgi:hypothetical protein
MHSPRRDRGSLLIVTLMFAAIIAISITSYLKLALNASKMANRSFYLDQAQNLVDTGLEHAMWSLNNSSNWSGGGFSAWSGHTNQYQGTLPSASTYFTFSGNVKGQVKMWVDNSTSTPHAVAKSTITLGDGTTFVKMSEAYMQKRSYFANGLVARNTLTFNGNVSIDSWISHADTATTTDDVAYSTSVKRDSGKIASLRTTVGSITVGNADVYGYAAVGGNSISDISVGSTGRVGPWGVANGTIDTSRITYDFTTNFPDVGSPSTGSVSTSYTLTAITGTTSLPRTNPGGHITDNPAADGKYYYFVPSIDIAGSDNINIIAGASVVVIATQTTGTAIKAAGNSAINIPATSALTMYTAGDVSITGNGVVNGTSTVPNPTTSFQLFGTRTAAATVASGMQSMSIKGNGYLSGIVYAPNADVVVTGNGDTLGAVVANSVDMHGNGSFHYDESLANIASSDLWAVSKWRELSTSTDRATYATQLNF